MRPPHSLVAHRFPVQEVTVYSDGACRGNPGLGGQGIMLVSDSREKELFSGKALTTNSRMELIAVIEAFRALKRSCRVQIYTDSQYVQKGVSEWLVGQKMRSWKAADKKPVKDNDLWHTLGELVAGHEVSWHWVEGYANHPGSGHTDALANKDVEMACQART